MSQKYSVKSVINGSTQKISLASPGAGQSGNALTLKATANARYQLMDVVTQSSPDKMRMKRVGDDLHIALPNGGDIDAPDIVIQNYYSTPGTTIWGNDQSGAWQRYATDSLAPSPTDGTAPEKSLFSSFFDSHKSAVSLEKGASDWTGWIESPWTLVGLAGAAGAYKLYRKQQDKEEAYSAATNASKPDAAALETLQNFTNDTHAIDAKTAATPSLMDYYNLGVKVMSSLSDPATKVSLITSTGAAATPLTATILNSTIDRIPGSELSLGRVQKAADSWFRILKVADGSATIHVDAYPNETDSSRRGLKAEDYANIGVNIKDAIGASSGNLTLKLLNEAVGRLASNKVDSADKLELLAETANDIMLLAKDGTPNASNSKLVDGLNILLGSSAINANNIEAIKKVIAACADDGSAVDTIDKLQNLLKPELALQAMRAYTDDPAAAGSKTAANITLDVYTALGIKAYNWPDTTDANRIDLSKTQLTDAILDTALDRIAGSDISKDRIQKMVDSYTRILKVADSKDARTDAYPETAGIDDLTLVDYTNIGVTVANAIGGSTNATLALLNDAVGRVVTAGKPELANTKVDSVQEIELLAKTADDVMLLAKGAAAKQSDADLVQGLNALLDMTGLRLDHLAAIKAALEGSADDGAGVDTVAEIKDLIKPVLALQYLKDYTADPGAIGSKNITSPTLQTYQDLGIKMYASLNNTTDAGRIDLSANFVTGVSTAATLNSAVDRLEAATLDKTKIQQLVDSYLRILTEANGNPDVQVDVYPSDPTIDNPTKDDYANIGVTIDNDMVLALVNDAVGRDSATQVDTVEEVAAIALAAKNVLLQAAGGAGVSYAINADWIAGLTALGISGATASNIDRILTAIKNTHAGSQVNTVAAIQALVSIEKLRDFDLDVMSLGSKLAPTPTLLDWSMAGLTANTSLSDGTRVALKKAPYWSSTNPQNGLNALNSALDTLSAASKTVDAATLQKIVDSYGRILQAADGSRTMLTDVSKVSSTLSSSTLNSTDFQNVGATVSTDAGVVDLLIDVVGSVSSSKVDTIAEINNLATAAQDVVKLAVSDLNRHTNAEWKDMLSAGLGLNNVNDNNIADIVDAIKGKTLATEVDTVDELQSIIGLTNINRYASNSANGTPTFDDYKILTANATSGNKAAYDSVVDIKFSNSFTATELASMVDSYNKIIAEADGDKYTDKTPGVNPSVQDFQNVQLGEGSSHKTQIQNQLNNNASFLTLLDDAVGAQNATAVDSVGKLNGLAVIVDKIMELANKPTGTTDYATAVGSLSINELTSLGLDTSLLSSATYSAQTVSNRFTRFQEYVVAADTGTADSLIELQNMLNSTHSVI